MLPWQQVKISYRAVIGQLIRYVLCGASAALIDVGAFMILARMGLWYVYASIVGGILGFFSAFILHKYIAFQKYEELTKQFIKYCLLGAVNILATTIILYGLVEVFTIPKDAAKIIANGSIVTWNFFLYKFFVYA